MYGSDCALIGFSDGVVTGWLDADESDLTDETGTPVALYRVILDTGPVMGDTEDLDSYELDESLLPLAP